MANPVDQDKVVAATNAVLDRIIAEAEEASAITILYLAEAYAWLRSPVQSHGGTPKAE